MSYVQNSLSFTIEALVGLYLIAVILRLLIGLLKIDTRNLISQTVLTVTNRPLAFFRLFTPGSNSTNLACILLVMVVAFLKYGLLVLVSGHPFNFKGILLLSVGESINIIIWIFLIAIIIQAILSWVAPRYYHPAIIFLAGLSEPILIPIRQLLLDLQGLDLSPIIAIVALNVLQTLVAHPIIDIANTMILS